MKKSILVILFIISFILGLQLSERTYADVHMSEDQDYVYQYNLNILQVSMGMYFTVILTEDGYVYTCGINDYGQLGNGTTTSSTIPINITDYFYLNDGEEIIQIETTTSRAAAITSDGRAFIWGRDWESTTSIPNLYPEDITGTVGLYPQEKIVEIALGSSHFGVLTSMSRVFTWGDNFYGQLGTGDLGDKDTPTNITSKFTVYGSIVKLSFNNTNSMAISDRGTIYSWGVNTYGQIGDGTTTTVRTPKVISDYFNLDLYENISDVSVGNGFSIAKTSNGRLFTWGINWDGQLGNGTTTSSKTPIDITSFVELDEDESIVFLQAENYRVSVITSNGRVLSWGRDGGGTLGDGGYKDVLVPTEMPIANGYVNDGISYIDYGFSHSAAVTTTGRLLLWGYNSNGQLGDGTTDDRTTILPLELSTEFELDHKTLPVSDPVLKFVQNARNAGIITQNNRVIVWGDNYYGQLGNGTTSVVSSYPEDITDNFNLAEGEIIEDIAFGTGHSAAKTSNGRVFFWGDNASYQLGDGTNVDSSYPIDITDKFVLNENEEIVKLSLGGHYSGVLTSENRIFIWGYNYYGQVGDGTTTTKKVPTEISGSFDFNEGEEVIDLILSYDFSALLTSEGRVFTWGNNGSGQLGDGTTQDRHLPHEITYNIPLLSEDKIIQIAAGERHMGALTDHDVLYVWGSNSYYQLGLHYESQVLNPQRLYIDFTAESGEKVSSIDFGLRSSSVLTTYGKLYTWGYNNVGQLGNDSTENTYLIQNITSGFDLLEGEVIVKQYMGSQLGMAITSEGMIYGWGSNGFTKLLGGNISAFYVTTPVRVNKRLSELGHIALTYTKNDYHYLEQNIHLDIYLSYDITDEISNITVNGVNYDSNFFSSENGKLELEFPLTGDIGNELIYEIQSITLVNGEILIASGNTLGITHIIEDTTGPSFETFYDLTLEVGTEPMDFLNMVKNIKDNTDALPYSITIDNQIDYDVVGIYYVIIQVEDVYHNVSEQTIEVVISDTTKPTFDLIGSQTIEAGTGNIDWSTYINNPADNYSTVLTSGESVDRVDYNTPGTYTASVYLRDEYNNTTYELIEVTVVDTTSPSFELPDRVTIPVFSVLPNWTDFMEELKDNSDGILEKFVVSSDVVQNEIGIYHVSLGLKDPSGNETIHILEVLISDTEDPTFDEILDQTIEAGASGYNWTDLIKNATDNYDNNLTLNVIEDNIQYDTVGVYTVTVSVTDSSQNSLQRTFNVEVVDTTKPTFDDIENQSLEVGSIPPDWTELILNTNDNATGLLTKAVVSDLIDYNVLGVYSVQVSLTDESNNSQVVQFQVEIVDTTSPSVPDIDSQTIEAGTSDIDWTTVVGDIADNYDTTFTLIELEDNVAYDVPGTYNAYVNVTDSSGNLTTVEITVVVEDTIAPTVNLNPSIDTIYLGDDYQEQGVSTYDITEVTVSIDGLVNVDTIETYVITYTVKDTSGNETIMKRVVTVLPKIPEIRFELHDTVTTINIGEVYQDGGCTIYINGTGHLMDVLVNNVDESTPGIYTVVYEYTDNEITYTHKRYVFIVSDDFSFDDLVLWKEEEEEIS